MQSSHAQQMTADEITYGNPELQAANLNVKKLSTGYIPRRLQDALHPALKRFNVIVCHRRWGKTVFAINEMVDQALRCAWGDPQYAYVAPTYGQAEKIAWNMLKKYTNMIPGVEYNESKLRCTIPRPWRKDKITIYLLGAENPDGIRGMYFDGALLDEYAEMDPRVWGEVLRPALSDRKGWAIFIGTAKGQNHFYDVLNLAKKNEAGNWFFSIQKASESRVLDEEELASMRAEMSEEQYNQEMECDFTAALIGAYWGKQMSFLAKEKRIGMVPHDPSLIVDTFWDLGINDTTTIWFVQQRAHDVRIIDYYEMSGEGLPHYAKILKSEHRADYNYREHNWPHDGKSKDLSTGKERSVTMQELGVRVKVHPKFAVADQIDAARRLLPKVRIDETRCARGIDALKNYEKNWDAKNKIWQDQPKHNWASHGADAFKLMGMVLKPGEDIRREQRRRLPTKCDNEYDVLGQR